MSYKERAKERGEEVDTTQEVRMSCVRCGQVRKGTTLAFYGGMCEACFGEYCKKPFPIPRRKA